MIKPLALLLAVVVTLQGTAALAESRLTGGADTGKAMSVSARLAIKVEIASTLTLQLDGAAPGSGLADGMVDNVLAVIRLSSNQGSATLSCAAQATNPPGGGGALLDQTLATPATARAAPGAQIAADCGSMSIGTSGINHWLDTAADTSVARFSPAHAHPAPARIYTASQP